MFSKNKKFEYRYPLGKSAGKPEVAMFFFFQLALYRVYVAGEQYYVTVLRDSAPLSVNWDNMGSVFSNTGKTSSHRLPATDLATDLTTQPSTDLATQPAALPATGLAELPATATKPPCTTELAALPVTGLAALPTTATKPPSATELARYLPPRYPPQLTKPPSATELATLLPVTGLAALPSTATGTKQPSAAELAAIWYLN